MRFAATQKKEYTVQTKIIDKKQNKINIFSKKIKKKIYTISTLKHKGLSAIKRLLVSYVH